MKIAIFGATGGLGLKFLEVALGKGHQIVAYARSPEKLENEHENLVVIEGDVFDVDKIKESLKGVDGVLITWRLRRQRIPLFSEGTQNVVDAMKANNVKRIIVISEYAYDDHYRNFGFFWRSLIRIFGKFMGFQQNERRKQDEVVRNSGLEWTIDRIRMLTDKEKDHPLELTFEPKNKFLSVYRGTAAEQILHQFENPEDFIQKDVYF